MTKQPIRPMKKQPAGQRYRSDVMTSEVAGLAPTGFKTISPYFHGRLRTKPSERVKMSPAGRRCACGKKLTSYNHSDNCYTCQKEA